VIHAARLAFLIMCVFAPLLAGIAGGSEVVMWVTGALGGAAAYATRLHARWRGSDAQR
jgi:hypothetical protein